MLKTKHGVVWGRGDSTELATDFSMIVLSMRKLYFTQQGLKDIIDITFREQEKFELEEANKKKQKKKWFLS